MRWTRPLIQQVWVFCDGSTGTLYWQEGQGAGGRGAGGKGQGARDREPGGGGKGLGRQAEGAGGRDGGQRGDERGRCTAAAVAWSATGEILEWAWQQLPLLTNNEAEYAGLLLGLTLAQKLRAQEAICLLDSEVVIGQMEGRFLVHSAALRTWHWQARAAERAVPTVRYCLIPREWNRLADGLAAQVSIPWATWRQVLGERLATRD